MAKKTTKMDNFNALLKLNEVQANPDLVAFVKHEIDLLAKKNSGEKKPTKTQEANEVLKQDILEALTETPVSVSDLIKTVPSLAELSNQKVSALVRQLVNEGKVVRTEEKRHAKFALA